jgi:RNA polymerase sigma-70 factor (ECF subfamily)
MPAEDVPDQLLALHKRLLAGDRTASEEVASRLLGPLTQEVSSQFPHVDQEHIWDGVVDALLDYCARPYQFDEGRRVPLDRFLRLAAWRNVANMFRGNNRRKVREERVGQDPTEVSVELDSVAGNIVQKEEIAAYQQRQKAIMNVLHNPQDRQIFALRLQGERRTEKFAEILGIGDLPIEAQRREVKRNKDRIDKILRRYTGGSL